MVMRRYRGPGEELIVRINLLAPVEPPGCTKHTGTVSGAPDCELGGLLADGPALGRKRAAQMRRDSIYRVL